MIDTQACNSCPFDYSTQNLNYRKNVIFTEKGLSTKWKHNDSSVTKKFQAQQSIKSATPTGF